MAKGFDDPARRKHPHLLSSVTGQTATCPASGSRKMLDAQVDALCWVDRVSRQWSVAARTAVDKAFAAVIINEVLANHFGHTIRRLRVRRYQIIDNVWHVAAKGRNGTRVDHARRVIEAPHRSA